MWNSPRSRARFNRACVRRVLASLSTTAMLFLQHGGVNHSRRWRGPALCAPRIRRAAFLRKVLTAKSVAACVSFTKQWLLIRSFMVRCVSPTAGRSSCDSVSGSESTTWCQDVISVLVVVDRISMPRKAAVVPLDGWLPLVWSVCGTIHSVRLQVFLLHVGIFTCTWPNGGPFADACFGVVWEESSSNVISFSSLWWTILRS